MSNKGFSNIKYSKMIYHGMTKTQNKKLFKSLKAQKSFSNVQSYLNENCKLF